MRAGNVDSHRPNPVNPPRSSHSNPFENIKSDKERIEKLITILAEIKLKQSSRQLASANSSLQPDLGLKGRRIKISSRQKATKSDRKPMQPASHEQGGGKPPTAAQQQKAVQAQATTKSEIREQIEKQKVFMGKIKVFMGKIKELKDLLDEIETPPVNKKVKTGRKRTSVAQRMDDLNEAVESLRQRNKMNSKLMNEVPKLTKEISELVQEINEDLQSTEFKEKERLKGIFTKNMKKWDFQLQRARAGIQTLGVIMSRKDEKQTEKKTEAAARRCFTFLPWPKGMKLW